METQPDLLVDSISSSAELLAQVAAEVAVCTACPLCQTRKRAVPGEGPATAEILFIGEGPGYNENEQGRPFVGAAGQFLDEMLAAIHLRRDAVYITNVVKCRPPGNRDPEPEEISACTTLHLKRQVHAIHPRMIVTLGRFSMGLFLPKARISQVHGKPFLTKGRVLVPMFHPAAALHQPDLRSAVLADFRRLPHYIEKMKAMTATEAEPAAPAREGLEAPYEPARPAPAEPGGEAAETLPAPRQLSLF